MKRIVLFNRTLSGGAGKFLVTLSNALAHQGIDVHLVLYKDHIEYDLSPTVTLHLLYAHTKPTIAQALKEYIATIQPVDIICSNSTPSNKILSQLPFDNIYHIVHSTEAKQYHGLLAPLRRRWRKQIYRKLYNGKKIITVSKGLESFILHQLQAQPASIHTLYNPFDLEEIRQLAQDRSTQTPNYPYIIHVGRFELRNKRQDILLKAYKKANLDEHLVLLGQGPDKKAIQALIHQLSLEDKVYIEGFSSNPYRWIKQAKLLVLSSDYEGFGRVLIEAAALQTPIISTDCPTGPNEILTGPFRQYLSKPGDIQALASHMQKALKSYPNGLENIAEQFSDRIIAQSWIDYFDKGA